MSREQLIAMARHNMRHAEAGTIDPEPDVFRVPASVYFDETRWRLEVERIFRRLPLMLAMTAELPKPGDYKAMDAGGVPVLLVRGDDGEVRAFMNSCAHRGAMLAEPGTGHAHRFTCPYHAWSYNTLGELIGVYAPKDFGEIDRSCYGLTRLPSLERAGLIWVTLNPESTLPIETFLSGYDEILSHFGFETWHHFAARTLPGPNWKIAYDGYMDLYHLPILHRATFGAEMPNQALYYPWGPHQRVSSPDPSLLKYRDQDESTWPTEHLIAGVWTIFPHVSIAGFDGGGRSVMISQLFPGDSPGSSFTVQNYLMEHEPDEEQAKAATEQFKFLEYVVAEEDYKTGLRQQRALAAGGRDHVLFGRNEGGGHRFHRWVERLLETPDEELEALFSEGANV